MKVITILQPFATLIALGEKNFETRSWKTDYSGDLLIHAGKGKQYLDWCDREPFKSVLLKHGYDKHNLPFGSIIAKTNLKNCLKVTENEYILLLVISATLENGYKVKGNELEFGDFAEERYAWQLDNVEMLKNPIPVKGQQKLWNFDYKEVQE